MLEKQYLDALIQSLKKKLLILNKLIIKNEEQKALLEDENLTTADFNFNVQEKALLIEELEGLDTGFEEVYNRVRDVIQSNQDEYKEQLLTLQELIKQIMERDAAVQVAEKRNYTLAQNKFASVKKQIREVNASQRAVSNYYRNMMSSGSMEPQFLDNKK